MLLPTPVPHVNHECITASSITESPHIHQPGGCQLSEHYAKQGQQQLLMLIDAFEQLIHNQVFKITKYPATLFAKFNLYR